MTREEFIAIIVKCQAGDRSAIGRIYEEYFGRMCVTAFGVIKNPDAAYDIASNVILKLLEFRQDFSCIGNPVGYLISMVHNEACDYIAKRRREVNVPEVYDYKINDMPDMLWLEDILTILTEKERELFVLCIAWDMTLKKAAKRLGITYSTAKMRYKNIKSKIKSIYKK